MEYIEREALIAAYDAAHKGEPGGARKLIEDAPAADVAPVVRCKDCTYRVEYFDSGKYVCTLWQCRCCGSADYVKPDDFCSYGERKDGDG